MKHVSLRSLRIRPSCRCLIFGEYDGELMIAMELVVGTHVGRLMRAASVRMEPLPLEDVLYVVSQAAHALAYAHRAHDDTGRPLGIVHRDVSPANLLISSTGHVKLSDFGIARAVDKTAVTEGGQVRGKLGYMSPEQVTAQPLNARSDVFTLSVVFAEMLTGAPLFGEGSDLDILMRIRDVDLRGLESSSRRIPQDVHRLIRLGLVKDARDRPSAAAFAEALDEIIRRRTAGGSADRLARLIMRYGLVRGGRVLSNGVEHGARHTSLVIANEDSAVTDKLLGESPVDSPQVYRVRFRDGAVLGPIDFANMIQMITSGEIGGGVDVSCQGAAYEPLETFAEFTRFVTSPVFRWKGELVTPSRLGKLRDGQLVPLVHKLASGRETGLLRLLDGTKGKKIYFVNGRPDYIASTDPEELLGEYLVSSGRCLRMEVDMALSLLERYGGRLGDSLVGLGILRPMELFHAVSDQVHARFIDAFTWTDGEWTFLENERSDEDTVPFGNSPQELLRDAAIATDTRAKQRLIASRSGDFLFENPSPQFPKSAYSVPDGWNGILSRAIGKCPVRAVEEELELGRCNQPDVVSAIYWGLSCEVLLQTA